jgi:hypothetical protein
LGVQGPGVMLETHQQVVMTHWWWQMVGIAGRNPPTSCLQLVGGAGAGIMVETGVEGGGGMINPSVSHLEQGRGGEMAVGG